MRPIVRVTREAVVERCRATLRIAITYHRDLDISVLRFACRHRITVSRPTQELSDTKLTRSSQLLLIGVYEYEPVDLTPLLLFRLPRCTFLGPHHFECRMA